MKIAIDIQSLQTNNSKNRGIGRYTYSVIEALFHHKNSPDFHLYANANLPDPELNKSNFSYSSVYYPYAGSSDINDLLLKTTLISSDNDIVFVPSPMEGLDSTIPDYVDFPNKVFVICYDLIPLIFSDRYLKDPNMQSLYMRRLKNVQNADFIFAISESSRQDVIKYLNIYPEKVLNVSGGVSSFFTPVPTYEQQTWLKKFADKFGICKKFILYTGGEDWRKNIEGLVKAFSKLPNNFQRDYQLVVACRVSDFFIKEISNLAAKLGVGKSLVLTNYITDEELRALYSTCSLFVFPSFYEGFGLPLLEAMSCGAPAIASNNSSLPEILGSPAQLFDPYSPDDMARTMYKVLYDIDFSTRISENALQQAGTFSWESVAQKMIDVFQEHQPINKITIAFNRVNLETDKPQLALFSPLPPAKSGIADYTKDLSPSLQKHLHLDLYHDDSYFPDTNLSQNLYPHSTFEARIHSQEYQGIIYQIGNSSYHCHIYSQLMRYPGITVLHDYYLGGLVNYLDVHHPKLGIKLAHELEHNYGKDRAVEILNLLKIGKLNVDDSLSKSGIYLNRRVFTRSLGVILHSKWAYNLAVKDFSYDNNFIVHIPHLIPQITVKEKYVKNERQSLEIPNDSFVISTFGFINKTKRPLKILHAFKKYLIDYPDAYLLFVGGTDYLGSIDIEQEINKLGLKGHVKVTGYVNMPDFYRYIEISDVCLNLRYPSNGESSGSLLRILSVGKPTIVTDIGSFSDFPNDVVVKIPQPTQSNEIEEILKALILLTENSEYRNFLSHKSSEYISREHSPEKCARLYSEFIHEVLKSPQAKQKQIADYVGREIAKIETYNIERVLTNFAGVISNDDQQKYLIEDTWDFTQNTQPIQITKNIDFNEFLHECRSICLAQMPPSHNILSIGCAGNWYFDWFDKYYPYSIENHTGIDLNSEPPTLPNNVTWIQHDGHDLSMIQSQSFDLVFAGQFIEHISWESQVKFLLEVNRTLKTGGIFVLDSPHYTITNRYGWKQPEHIHELTFEQASELLLIAGFEIQDSYGLVPQDLLGKPPELFDQYLKSSLIVNLSPEDISVAINKDPSSCFVWWIVAKKRQELPISAQNLTERMREFYIENQKVKNEVVYHQIGKIIKNNQAYFVQAEPNDGEGFALFGPYDLYSAGNYVVEFEIHPNNEQINHNQIDSTVAMIDVSANAGASILAEAKIKFSHLLKSRKISLTFSLEVDSLLEFRVLSLGILPLLIGIKPKVLPIQTS